MQLFYWTYLLFVLSNVMSSSSCSWKYFPPLVVFILLNFLWTGSLIWGLNSVRAIVGNFFLINTVRNIQIGWGFIEVMSKMTCSLHYGLPCVFTALFEWNIVIHSRAVSCPHARPCVSHVSACLDITFRVAPVEWFIIRVLWTTER